MSLLFTKLFQQQCRQATCHLMSARCVSNFTMTSSSSPTLNKEFWSKNKQLNRPMSPHLTIYKFQLPANLSILHRITGLGASVVLYTGGIGALFCTGQSFPEIVQLIQDNVPSLLIKGTKAAIGGSLLYHTLNGVRHLVWDVGYGFRMQHLYISGYIVVAMTAIGTAYIFIQG